MFMVWWEAALPIVLRSSKNYHHEHAKESHLLPKDIATAWGAVIYVSTKFPTCRSNLYILY